MTGTETLLRAEGLSKSFGGLRAVHEVSLQIDTGAVLGLIGPNGAGKSTLVDLIAGRTPTDAGTVTLLGEDVTRRPPHYRARQGLIRTFQQTRTFPLLNGTDVVLAGLASGAEDSFVRWVFRPRWAWKERRRLGAEAKALLRATELDSALGSTPVGLLAPAVNRLLGFAVALSAQPRVLVLDEPGAGLSPAERVLLSRRIRGAAATGIGVLVIEHDVGFIMRTCDRVVAVDHGVVIADGTPDEVRADPAVRRAYLGDADVAS